MLFLIIAQFVVGMLASVPLLASGMGSAFEAAQSGADPSQLEAQMMAGMADGLAATVWISVATAALTALLLVASFVRRLHDVGQPGYWAAIPLVTQAAALWASIGSVDKVREMMLSAQSAAELQAMQGEVAGDPLNYVGWLGYLVIIVFGIMKSQEGTNPYGLPPAA
ncbi:MAG: DUF805 domain-containing protein [Erythrobacter sp.]|nr:MAG: DUF805 domain-containing protein [Erythrobacter sp.]